MSDGAVSGTAAYPMRYEYGIKGGRRFEKQIMVGAANAETERVKSYADLAGRQSLRMLADGATEQSFYNALGQMQRTVDADGVTILYAYSAEGEREISAVDFNGNGTIDYAGPDRITRTVTDYAAAHGPGVRRATPAVWAGEGDAATTVSVQEQSTDGYQSWSTASEQTTHSATVLGGGGAWTMTVREPSAAKRVEQYTDGRLASWWRQDNAGTVIGETTRTYPKCRVES